jgi:hypothetical protein
MSHEYKPTNREKSKRASKHYNICFDCEGRRPGGCKNCKPSKQFSRAMKKEKRNKKQDNI